MADSSQHQDSFDPATAWREAHDRVCALALDLPPAQTEAVVPATPDWTVRDLLAHVVGVGVDAASGDEDPDHAAWWTKKHIEERAGREVLELVEEWRGAADDIERHLREESPRPLADLVIHEHDLRGAVDRPGAQQTRALGWVTGGMLRSAATALRGGASLALVSPSGSWTSDGGPVEDTDVEIRTSDFDVARALTTRRTLAQLQGWCVRGDAETVLAAFTLLGPLPTQELPC